MVDKEIGEIKMNKEILELIDKYSVEFSNFSYEGIKDIIMNINDSTSNINIININGHINVN